MTETDGNDPLSRQQPIRVILPMGEITPIDVNNLARPTDFLVRPKSQGVNNFHATLRFKRQTSCYPFHAPGDECHLARPRTQELQLCHERKPSFFPTIYTTQTVLLFAERIPPKCAIGMKLGFELMPLRAVWRCRKISSASRERMRLIFSEWWSGNRGRRD